MLPLERRTMYAIRHAMLDDAAVVAKAYVRQRDTVIWQVKWNGWDVMVELFSSVFQITSTENIRIFMGDELVEIWSSSQASFFVKPPSRLALTKLMLIVP